MRTPLRSLLALALALPLLRAENALAEPSTPDVGTARRLFEEATELEKQSAWQEASAKLEAALAIKETPGLHFHRAHCAEQLGELVLAARHYTRSEEMIRAGAAAPDVEELLSAARARVLARVPRLTLAFPNDVAGATLEIDGSKVTGAPGTPILLDPGRHKIVARAPGRRDFEMEITLNEGQTQTLEVSLAKPRESAPPPAATKAQKTVADESNFGTREIVLIGEATLAVAGLATGIGFSFARASAKDRATRAQSSVDASTGGDSDHSDGCSRESPTRICAELFSALDDQERAATFQTVGFVAAGVGAAATLVTFALWPSDPARASASVEKKDGGAMLSLRARF